MIGDHLPLTSQTREALASEFLPVSGVSDLGNVPPTAVCMPVAAAPRVALLASTAWWPSTARIAMRFAALGWRVEALCPSGHPLHTTRAVARVHRYAALQPAAAWTAAITAAAPDLIVPCDDRAVAHLRDLHARPGIAATKLARVIARSLGRLES